MAHLIKKHLRGFTLVELVIVIIIVGILAGVMAPLIALPVKGYIDQQRRGGLVDRAQVALNTISRELRLALPMSVRVRINGLNYVMEFMRTASGGRYREGGAGDSLAFAVNDTSFDVLGTLSCAGVDPGGAGTTNPGDCRDGVTSCLVVGYAGPPAAGYIGGAQGTFTEVETCAAGSVTFPATNFPVTSQSPNQRFYIVDTPITYLCDPVAGTIYRYHNYEIRDNQDDVDTHDDLINNPGVPLTNFAEVSLVIDNISDCTFTTALGGNQINASITVTDPDSSESVELFEQIKIPNGL